VDVQVLRKIPNITLPALRARPELAEMLVLKKGNRLSITPVEARHWQAIETLAARAEERSSRA
jgi:predicted RNA-binding protein with PUA-like domain